LASSRLKAIPDTTACSILTSSSKVMSVPDWASSSMSMSHGVKLERTQRHAVLAGELDRADLQHLRAEARHLEHLLEADGRRRRASATMRGSVV
jgi:hypothetical protein